MPDPAAVVTDAALRYAVSMNAIPKRIVMDEQGTPLEVILPRQTFCESQEALGMDLDAKAEADLRETREDLAAGQTGAFLPTSAR